MSNYRIKYGIIQNNLKYQFGLLHYDGLVKTIEVDISFAYFGVWMKRYEKDKFADVIVGPTASRPTCACVPRGGQSLAAATAATR
jgi:hypothetical protein